jgi:hypothetical protein
MTGRKKGLETISLIQAVKEFSTNSSLADAKSDVERLIAGQTVKLKFENESKKEEFRMKAEGLGAICS